MRKGKIMIIAGLLLIAAALSLTGYNLLFNRRAGNAAAEVLSELEPAIKTDPVPPEGRMRYVESGADGKTGEDTGTPAMPIEDDMEYPDYVLNPEMPMPVQMIKGLPYIGKLRIDTLNLELPVCEDWSTYRLERSPCRYAGSVYLDNMVICAHRVDWHFGRLVILNYGDIITFTDMDGNVFEYEVSEIETLKPRESEEMINADDWDLTLFTCTIDSTKRLAVRCVRI